MKRLATYLLATSCLLTTLPSFAQTTTTQKAPARTTTTASAKPKIAVFKLADTLLEKPESFSFSALMGGAKPASLSQLITSLNKAAKDPTVGGVMLDLRSFELSLAHAEELGSLLQQLRQAKKQVVVFSSDYDTPTYILASHANFVVMPENGNVLIPGSSLGMMFFKGTLDKLNIQADMIQVGKFKGAEEPFTRTQASPEYQQQITQLVDSRYNLVIKTIATNRKLSEKDVTAVVDEGWMFGKRAKALGLVDQLMNRSALDAWCEKLFENGAEIVTNYGEAKKKNIDLDNPFAIFAILGEAKTKTRSNQPAIAVIYADGAITGDQDGDGLSSEENVTPSHIRKAVDKALKDDLVKALVLRVNSPGGSASASDEIWQILKEADAKKPVTVSMGHVAASGGYYIACAGRTITADQATITGSIGVVGGKIVIKGLLDNIGINVQPISRGQHAQTLSPTCPFTDEERQFIRSRMTEIYDLFTTRVKDGRGDKIKDITLVAQGRLFDGQAAKDVGLVDNIGSLDDTIRAAAKTAGIEKNYQIINYPEPKTLSDILREGFNVDASSPVLGRDMNTLLKAIPVEYQRQVFHALQMLHTLQQEKVMTACPVGIVEK